jgi:hypothetical protein
MKNTILRIIPASNYNLNGFPWLVQEYRKGWFVKKWHSITMCPTLKEAEYVVSFLEKRENSPKQG